jgi:hypothetical protein
VFTLKLPESFPVKEEPSTKAPIRVAAAIDLNVVMFI